MTLADLGYTGATNANNFTYSFPYGITSANTGNTVVLRNLLVHFSAGTITASLSGNATSASDLPAKVTFNIKHTRLHDKSTLRFSNSTVAQGKYIKIQALSISEIQCKLEHSRCIEW